MDSWGRDFLYGWRGLRRAPGFAAVAILTLGLGIGANTAIFSIIDAVLLRPLPYHNPGELVRLYETEDAPGNYPFTGPDFLDWKTQNHSFQDMVVYSWGQDMNLSGKGEPDHVIGTPVEANFFSLLGARPLLGRTFAAGEDEKGRDRVAILGYGLWQTKFDGNPGIVGQQIELDNRKYDVIGVMPAGFHFPSDAQMWIPQDMDSKTLGRRGMHWLNAIGRLKPGVSLQQAQAEMTLIAAQLEKQYPDSNHKVGASLVGMHEDVVGESRASLLMMLGAVVLVLLIACANVANLLLSRAVGRQKEMAIRGAMGASRFRLARQMLAESALLGTAGGILGLLFAWGGVRVITTLKHVGLPRANAIEINLAVLAFTFGVALVTGLAFGLFPALQNARPELYEALKSGAGSSGTTARHRGFLRDGLVIAEVGLSLLLLISATLLLKDFMRLRNTDVGVRSTGVWTGAIALPEVKYPHQQERFNFSEALLAKLRNVPGLDSVSISDKVPLEGGSNSYVTLRGQSTQAMSGPLVENHSVSPGYFRAMGIPILQGRDFTAQDATNALAIDLRQHEASEARITLPPGQTNAMMYPVVINQAMARYFWPNQDPIGQMFSFSEKNGPWRQVVGVAGDVKQYLTHAPAPEAYDIFDGSSWLIIVAHSPSSSYSIAPEIRRALAQVDPGLPLFRVRTMDEIVAEHASGQQFLAGLLGLFAALAILLAGVGIYGVLSYLVTQRSREIGIRISLGATRGRVLTMTLKQGMRLACIGFAIGLVGALAAARVLASVLHEVHPRDVGIMVTAPLALAVVVLAACYLPAYRASKVDPMDALRQE
ncbi:MAG TPA: ABC transporter permease [Candidatus Eisenbacteria bacterium]|nr:ABC transporter permease [Candidatus Eisenbacteria bacterium]